MDDPVSGDDRYPADPSRCDEEAIARILMPRVRHHLRGLKRNSLLNWNDPCSGCAHSVPEPPGRRIAAQVRSISHATLLRGDRQFPRRDRGDEQCPGLLIFTNRDQRLFRQFCLTAHEPVERVRVEQDTGQGSGLGTIRIGLRPPRTLYRLRRDGLRQVEALLDRQMALQRTGTAHRDKSSRFGIADNLIASCFLGLCHGLYNSDQPLSFQLFVRLTANLIRARRQALPRCPPARSPPSSSGDEAADAVGRATAAPGRVRSSTATSSAGASRTRSRRSTEAARARRPPWYPGVGGREVMACAGPVCASAPLREP